jgi:predicted DNA-binding transcriptional regulator AlpA
VGSRLPRMTHTSSQPTPTTPDQLLRVDEVGALLAIDPRTVKTLAARGVLRRVVLGRRTTRYRASEVAELIERRTVQPT